MNIGEFPVMPQTALIIGIGAYLVMGWRGLIASGLLALFGMIKTEGGDAEDTGSGGGGGRRGNKLGQTIADFPEPPRRG